MLAVAGSVAPHDASVGAAGSVGGVLLALLDSIDLSPKLSGGSGGTCAVVPVGSADFNSGVSSFSSSTPVVITIN